MLFDINGFANHLKQRMGELKNSQDKDKRNDQSIFGIGATLPIQRPYDALMSTLRIRLIDVVVNRDDVILTYMSSVDVFLHSDLVNKFINNQLIRLLRYRVLIENAQKLTKEKAILGTALVDKMLEYKLQRIIARVIGSNFIKTRAKDLFLNFMMSPTGQDIFRSNLANALMSEKVRKESVDSLLYAVYSHIVQQDVHVYNS